MFETLVGNAYIKERIRDMLDSGRLVHSFIIEGEEGLGKHTLASIITAAANCVGANPPCGECKFCKAAKNFSHPDIKLYKPTKTRFSIDTVREIRKEAYIMPIEAERQVFILQNAELLTIEAANALLKILEEPPETAMFILLTESAALLPVTVRSRCLTLTLSEPDAKDAADYIAKRFPERSYDEITKLLQNSCNIGKAVKQLSGDEGDVLETASKCFRALSDRNLYELLEIFSKIGKGQPDAKRVLSALYEMLVQTVSGAYKGEDSPFSEESLFKMADLLQSAVADLAANCNTQLVMTHTAVALSKLAKQPDPIGGNSQW